MTKAVFIIIFLMLWGQVATAQIADQTVFTIDVHENGDALWTVEKRVSLTASDLNEWEAMIKNGQNISRYQNQIKTDLDLLLSSAQNSSNRSMEIENLNISYSTERTLSSGTGIIVYSFEWKNFSRIDSGKILIGDTFSGGNVFSPDNTLIIKIPSGFEVQSVSPKFDKQVENSLIWNGQSFDKGEPSLVLTRTIVDKNTSPATLSNAVMIPIVILIAGAILVVWKWRRSHNRKDSTVLTGSDENNVSRTGNNGVDSGDNASQAGSLSAGIVQIDKAGAETAVQTNNIGIDTSQADDAGINATPANSITTEDNENDVSQPPLPYLPEEFLSDEEMIERYLTKCGGQAYQSDIVKDSGLSKSKISIVLAKMKEDGKVIKIKKGKENIIRLAAKKE